MLTVESYAKTCPLDNWLGEFGQWKMNGDIYKLEKAMDKATGRHVITWNRTVMLV